MQRFSLRGLLTTEIHLRPPRLFMQRFSLRSLMTTIGYIAVACAALSYASPFWWALTYGSTLVLLFAAPLYAIYRTGPSRAFWVGVAVFGWGYVVLMAGNPQGPAASRLPTGVVLNFFGGMTAEQNYSDRYRYYPYTNVQPPSPRRPVLSSVTQPPNARDFVGVGHALFIALWALVGGALARHVYTSREAVLGTPPHGTS